MIRLEGLSKRFRTPAGYKVVADDINLVIPGGITVGLLGRNGAGKSTLLEMIGGRLLPDRGRIRTSGSISWPVGFAGTFHGNLTGIQNTRFVARIYGVDTDSLVRFVAGFAELGAHFQLPLRTYSAGMKARLAFGVSIGIPFDTYLVDEVTSVGDAAFRQKSQRVFGERMQSAGAVVVTHSPAQLRNMCQAGMVLDDGRLQYFDDIEDAIACHETNMNMAMAQD
jgi:capsular polysaccharide transport system ATP-binding protein